MIVLKNKDLPTVWEEFHALDALQPNRFEHCRGGRRQCGNANPHPVDPPVELRLEYLLGRDCASAGDDNVNLFVAHRCLHEPVARARGPGLGRLGHTAFDRADTGSAR